MEQLRIAVCEDDRADRERLCAWINAVGIPVSIAVFETGEAFLAACQPGRFDLIFMDIYLGGMDGVETVRRVRELDGDVPVAFTTVSKDFALESYRLDVKKYIEKDSPAAQRMVDEMLTLARDRRTAREGDIILFGRRNPLCVPAARLRYVEQREHSLIFHLIGGETRKRKGRLDEFEPLVADRPFFRCHKSYLVNLSFVQDIDRERMVFQMREGGSAYIRRELFYQARNAWGSWLFSAACEKGEGNGQCH